MLYSSVAPVGAVMTMVPVAMLQEGCTVTDAVGATGAVGAAVTIREVDGDTQPVIEFLTVTG